ncbi:lmo0937 family membrane protein [Psychroserpens sp.]
MYFIYPLGELVHILLVIAVVLVILPSIKKLK